MKSTRRGMRCSSFGGELRLPSEGEDAMKRGLVMSKETAHFGERLAQRFEKADYPFLKKTILKALEKCMIGRTIRYTHPLYNITVVVEKKNNLGGHELVTAWKG